LLFEFIELYMISPMLYFLLLDKGSVSKSELSSFVWRLMSISLTREDFFITLALLLFIIDL